MNRFVFLFVIVAISCFAGGVFGVMHDQVSYSFSPEYFTKFKFYQFGLISDGDTPVFSDIRLAVAMVGFLATWWMGIPIGLVIGILSFSAGKKKFGLSFKAILIIISVTVFFSLLGLVTGKLWVSKWDVNWHYPEDLIDKSAFIAVGTMHNFSYIGGVAGLLVAVVWILKLRKRQKDYTHR